MQEMFSTALRLTPGSRLPLARRTIGKKKFSPVKAEKGRNNKKQKIPKLRSARSD